MHSPRTAAVVCFGELLLRLDPPRGERLLQAGELVVSFTGGEANTAVALANWGESVRLVSSVPAHDLGQACLNHFRRFGVDVASVVRGGERLGILYVEPGAGPRAPKVIYDRQHTSFRSLQPGSIDWDQALAGADWFHFTGTAPAIGTGVRQLLREGLQQARERGLRISFDSSYRSLLWSVEEAATEFQQLLPLVDLFIGSASDAVQFCGLPAGEPDLLRALAARYQLRGVVFVEREMTPSGGQSYTAQAFLNGELASSHRHELHIVDRIGAGDALAAGLIYRLRQQQPLEDALNFAIAAGVLAHTLPGDLALLSEAEVQSLAQQGTSTRGWR
jgi:2-dehydro-3-deoxygluconokinase